MRVIAGALGGRRLLAPKGRTTRPTSDRVREALFSALGDVRGATVLDLYAGTGALGIEALSRGARRAVFVESGRQALSVLRANLDALELGGASRVVAAPAVRGIQDASRDGPFDLVLMDPPYSASGDVPTLLAALLLLPNALAPQARVIVEHARRDPAPKVAGLSHEETRNYGDTALSSYTRIADVG